LDIKLKRSKIENVGFGIFGGIFLVALTILAVESDDRFLFMFFNIMFFSLMGILIIGMNWIFRRWSNMPNKDKTIVNNKIIINRISKLQIPLIIYYPLSYLIIAIFPSYRRSIYNYLMEYSEYTYMLQYMYLIIPICYEIIIAYHVYIYYYYYEKKRQVQKFEMMLNTISDGNIPNSNPFTEKEQYYNYGEVLLNLGSITTKAVSDKLQNEKMKVELITNVSHDLKTPLTSMVGYIELMKKEELSEIMSDYVAGISDKAEKLNEMVQSLFDLAKTASGNADLHMETINMNRLIVQIMADMDNAIKSNEKLIKLSLSEENVDYIADSAYMYRVCQNLIENAIKYSLSGSRIIVSTVIHEGNIILTIKNVANYEMNFSEDEITERFTRGDEARSTDGNGLGLAIAKTYTEACGGHFSVKVDDDMFVAKVEFSVG